MKEYCIYIKQGLGKTYILNTFSNIESAKLKVLDKLDTDSPSGI